MIHIFKNLLPSKAKKNIQRYYKGQFKSQHSQRYDKFRNKTPEVALEQKHLQHVNALPHRIDFLKLLPKQGVIAEVGVDEGNFSEEILAHAQPKKLHLVDLWGEARYSQEKRKGVETKLSQQIAAGVVEVNLGYSTEVVKQFPENYFDCVYIDTLHDYRLTSEELHAYGAKLKPDGILAGHDYIEGNWRGLVKYGVIDAVHEFCVKEGWEFVYLTMETREHRSFAIRKITT